MAIDRISLSIFEFQSNTSHFQLFEETHGADRRWVRGEHEPVNAEVHVLHVGTDDGLEGICTVGDARYTSMRRGDLEQLRKLTLGENPFDRERLYNKLYASTRGVFGKQGWFGAFDNCLWDIAGKAAGLPVYALMGRARERCPAYLNISGSLLEHLNLVLASAQHGVAQGYTALKDHFADTAANNITLCKTLRQTLGDDIALIHDAVPAGYTLRDAMRVGRALDALDYVWMEEPLPDTEMASLVRLCSAVEIPIVAPEALMHDIRLCAQWLMAGATDWIRANGRHGATGMLKLAHLAEMHDARIEFNGPGGLFGLVHAHLVCAVSNTSYYEKFGGTSRDLVGKEIGLTNPPLPIDGFIAPPEEPGWGAIWDWERFEAARVAVV